MEIKRCQKCGLEKELNKDNFYWRKDCNNWKNECKACVINKTHIYYENNTEKVKERERIRRINKKEYITEKQKIWYEKNKDQINLKNKEKYVAHPREKIQNIEEHTKAYQKKYRQDKKEILNKNKKEYMKLRKKNDPAYKLRTNVSGAIYHYLKKNGSKKSGSIIKYLPYTFKELKKHLKSLFEPWMNWNNRGQYKLNEWDDNNQSTWKWQLDHIIPQSKLPYDSMEHPNFNKCWALENLRPISAKQNVLDGVKLPRPRK